jgi:hypothetical protein
MKRFFLFALGLGCALLVARAVLRLRWDLEGVECQIALMSQSEWRRQLANAARQRGVVAG